MIFRQNHIKLRLAKNDFANTLEETLSLYIFIYLTNDLDFDFEFCLETTWRRIGF